MKKAIIIGINSEIGSSIANKIKDRYEILGTYLRNSKSEFTVKKLDLSNRDEINKFTEDIDKIDLLICCSANKLTFNKFEKIDISTFDEDMRINALNTIYLTKKLIPKMNTNSAIIYLLTEMVEGTPPKYFSSYITSKYALLGFMKSLSEELESIRVNAVSPGMMDTKFIDELPNFIKEIYKNKSVSKELVSKERVADEVNKLIDAESSGRNIIIK